MSRDQPLHSSLGNKSKTPSQKKERKKERKREREKEKERKKKKERKKEITLKIKTNRIRLKSYTLIIFLKVIKL